MQLSDKNRKPRRPSHSLINKFSTLSLLFLLAYLPPFLQFLVLKEIFAKAHFVNPDQQAEASLTSVLASEEVVVRHLLSAVLATGERKTVMKCILC
jgi:hypothetical protein